MKLDTRIQKIEKLFIRNLQRDGVTENTIRCYNTQVKSFMRFLDKPPREATSQEIQSFLSDVSKRGSTGYFGIACAAIDRLYSDVLDQRPKIIAIENFMYLKRSQLMGQKKKPKAVKTA